MEKMVKIPLKGCCLLMPSKPYGRKRGL